MVDYTPNPFPVPKLIAEPPRKVYAKSWGFLKREKDQWQKTWEDVADYLLPYIGMRYEGETSYADRRPKRSRRVPVVINNKAGMAARILINGLASGLTSPSRPWLKLGLPRGVGEPDHEARKWLWGASQAIMWLAGTSNYYTATKFQYRDLVVFGPGAKIIDEHPEHNVNCVNVPVGSYCLTLGEDGRPQGLHREVLYRVGTAVERWGNRVSADVMRDYDRGDYYKEVKICHVIEPNRLYQSGKYGMYGKRFASVYYEAGCQDNHDDLLSYKGYYEKCFSAPRWDYLPGDVYGPSAALDTIGDVKALQVLELRKAQAVDKQVTPPTQGPPSLMGKRIGHMPGSHTIVAEVNAKITSLYDVRPDMLMPLSAEIREHERRIDEAFFVDIIRSATDLTRQNVKAEEIIERREEKMMAFSPVLENLFTELLDVDVMRFLAIGMRIGLIPAPPKSLRESKFKIEYISVLAQMQKASSISSIERTFTFAGSLAGVYPEIKDKLDADAAVEEYADAVGAPASLIVPARAVAEMRQMRQQQAQQQAAMEQSAAAVEGAKNLSEAKLTDPSMLQYLIGGAGA